MSVSARVAAPVVLVFVGFQLVTTAQTPRAATPADVPAKFDAQGFSIFLVPVRVNGSTFWCNLDSGGSWVFSMDTAKALKADYARMPRARALALGRTFDRTSAFVA